MDFEEAAARVQNNMSAGGSQEVVSVTAIAAVLSILVNLLKLRRECKKMKAERQAESVKEACQRNTWMTRRMVSKTVREVLGREDYRRRGPAMVDAVIASGAAASPEELRQLISRQSGGWTEV
jgi:hypothetical protein